MEQEYTIVALVIVITVGTTASELFKHYFKHNHLGPLVNSSSGKQLHKQVEQLKEQNQALQQRIQVLEKLATDPANELKQQINSL
ncbi:hypothetical protein L2735_12940 [Shewanella olleyana]|uniref:hypothetical protein n=1 Tax=Shewanella olleyana TaxID=135626 RepID=UPI00200EA870|nr:hypothetical protein [Shewanella olleyana]MCL1067698.1 hypothetical protein [Shewanella olleyana]